MKLRCAWIPKFYFCDEKVRVRYLKGKRVLLLDPVTRLTVAIFHERDGEVFFKLLSPAKMTVNGKQVRECPCAEGDRIEYLGHVLFLIQVKPSSIKSVFVPAERGWAHYFLCLPRFLQTQFRGHCD